ncbi:MAG: HEAT repeat domain-containing protein, partial [Phycisphaerales bacterium]|nr:HEAT repeat domain-containing protein [Phycisphaerales bacterium]
MFTVCHGHLARSFARLSLPQWGKLGAYAASGVASMFTLVGCIPPVPGGFDSPDPTMRLAAIAEAGRAGDTGAVPDLIEQLESTDPGARLLAIRSLERITGRTHGYDHAAPWWERG